MSRSWVSLRWRERSVAWRTDSSVTRCGIRGWVSGRAKHAALYSHQLISPIPFYLSIPSISQRKRALTTLPSPHTATTNASPPYTH
jgi:hypothetical protein